MRASVIYRIIADFANKRDAHLRWDRSSLLSTLFERRSFLLRLWLRLRLLLERDADSVQLSPLPPASVASALLLRKYSNEKVA